MNPTQTALQNAGTRNLFEGIETLGEIEKPESVIDSVRHSSSDKENIRNDWEAFYNQRSETSVETHAESIAPQTYSNEFNQDNFLEPDLKPIFVIENQKGGSSLEEAGLKIDFPTLGKEIGRSLFGVFSLFGEIFKDTLDLIIPKKIKAKEKPETDPEKARAKAERKAENQRKQGNMKAFFDALRAQTSAFFTIDSERADAQEKANINLTAKTGHESYKGIKDAFGRLTVYASSLLEKAQLDQDKKVKKQEKELKIASVGGAPDMNMDKVAEGGFLSSTGGQGAG